MAQDNRAHEFPILEEDGLGAPPSVRHAAEQLLPLLYDDVRRLARWQRRSLRAGETMQTTALVHEAYLKLHNAPGFADQAHFLRAAALAMRHVLINHARDRIAEKRGGGAIMIPLEQAGQLGLETDERLLAINQALAGLAAFSPRLAQVVECRFFAGFSEEETALALGLTDRTVRRDWVKARAWLRRELDAAAEDVPA